MSDKKIGSWYWFDFAKLDSTNNYALSQAPSLSSSQKILYTAQMQTSGRGRRGRSWVSPLGNLYFSQLFFSSLSPVEIVYITALSIVQTIKKITDKLVPQIKWPNDILINDCKIGGILIEKSKEEAYIIGVGINLISSPKLHSIYPAASLHDFEIDINRDDFLKLYLTAFDDNLLQSFTAIKNNFLANAYKLHQNITIGLGDKKISGQFIGIDENGFLLLKQEENTLIINTGEILFS